MKTKFQSALRLFTLGTLGFAFCTAAPAYEYSTSGGSKICWDDTSVKLRMSEISFTEGDAWSDAFEMAINQWTKNPSPFYFYPQYGDGSVSTNNSQSEVFFTTDSNFLGGAPAATLVASRGDEIVWTDIGFDAAFDWMSGDTATSSVGYGGNFRPFTSSAIHELGHALGLDHEDDEYNMMGTSYTHLSCNAGSLIFGPGEDASNGAVFLYGLYSEDFEDVGATHWKYLGRDGNGYSTHTRTVVKSSGGTTLAVHAGTEDDPCYEVTSGQTVKVEFTLENNGKHTQSPLVGYYFSSNNNITTSDTLLTTRTPTIGRNSVYTTDYTVTLPNNLLSGHTYYLGIIMDKNDTLSEVREGNNATYVGIYVR